MKGYSLRTPEGARAFVKQQCDQARQWFAEFGEVPALVWLLPSVDPNTGQRFPEGTNAALALFPEEQFSGPEDKERFMQKVREMSLKLGAYGTLFLAESWTVRMESEAPYHEWRRRNPTASLGQCPGAKEIVMMSLEHEKAGTVTWQAEISRDATGKGSLGEFVELPIQNISGRFSRLLARHFAD